jgi:Tfp pilus assembly protein PilO
MALNVNLSKLPWYTQVGTFLALSIAGMAAFYYVYAAPKQEEMAGQQRQLEALRTEISKGLATARKLPEFRAEVQTLEARLQGLRTVLPEEKDVGDLLRRLQTLAVQESLTIRAFKPGVVVPKQMYAEVPYALELEGLPHRAFFDRVSKFPRIINISDIDIKGRDRPEPNSTITAQCLATTFVLVESPPPAKPGAPGAAAAATPGRPAAPPVR